MRETPALSTNNFQLTLDFEKDEEFGNNCCDCSLYKR